MKKLLTIILVFIAIKSQAQVTMPVNTYPLTLGSGTWGYNVNFISKDTTMIDTVRIDYLVIDTVNESWHSYCDMNYIRGYRVDIRRGDYSNFVVPTSCPEGRVGCLVAHFKIEFVRPPVIRSYYISGHKLRISNEFLIKELP